MISVLAQLVSEKMKNLPGEAVFKLFIKDCQPTTMNLSIWGNQTSILQILKRHHDICEVVRVLNINDPPDSGKKEDVVTAVLKHMPLLTSFDARGCRKLGVESMKYLGSCVHITRLNVSFTAITIQHLKPILTLSKLQILKISNTPLGPDKGIAAVINDVPLDSAAPLLRLKVSNTDFGSQSFEATSKKFGRTLVSIDMMNTTCRKLAPLKSFGRLEKLNLSHLTKIKEGVPELPKDFVSAVRDSQEAHGVARLQIFICGGNPVSLYLNRWQSWTHYHWLLVQPDVSQQGIDVKITSRIFHKVSSTPLYCTSPAYLVCRSSVVYAS